MATKGLYSKFKQALLNKEVDLDTDQLRAVLIRTVAGAGAGGNTVYTPNLATDANLSAVPNNAYCRAATVAITIGTVTITDGVVDVPDIVWSAVASGDAIQGILIYDDAHANDIPILFTDQESGQPIIPNGTDITAQIDNGASKLFAI